MRKHYGASGYVKPSESEINREDRLRAALEEIVRIPSMPFPDAGAHSWRAFGEAAFRAWSRIQQLAREALLADSISVVKSANPGQVDSLLRDLGKQWFCENPECSAGFSEYINGCPHCSEKGLHFSVRQRSPE